MMDLDHMLVVAIDGGGTRCRVAGQDGGGRVAVETGSANVSTDLDGAVRQIVSGIEALAARMGCAAGVLWSAPAFVGLAGVTGTEMADRVARALAFRNVRIADDRPAAVRGVLGRRDGVLGHCGTGSFYATQVAGQIRLSGGWGPVLGDEASAQWVGRAALRLALETVDGRLAPTALSEHLLAEFGDAPGIVRFAGSARPADFGALAPLVTGHAGKGDAIAVQIMQQGADQIDRALRHLNWRPGQVVCLTGGIGPLYQPYLPADLRGSVADREGEPLDGAISLAKELAQETPHARR